MLLDAEGESFDLQEAETSRWWQRWWRRGGREALNHGPLLLFGKLTHQSSVIVLPS